MEVAVNMYEGFKVLSRESGNPPSTLNFWPNIVQFKVGRTGAV